MTGLRALAGAAALAAFAATGAAASTITINFDGPQTDPYYEQGFKFTPINLQSGNCDVAPCPHNLDQMVMTYEEGTGVFDLLSMYFHFQGNAGTILTVFETGNTDNSITFTQGSPWAGNTGHTFDFDDQFIGVTSITFDQTNNPGNVRIDTLKVTVADVAPIPLPAAGFLLLGALGGLGLVARKRRRAA